MECQIEALLLADNIYQDVSSKKFVLSGLFHQINTSELPFILSCSFGVFISVSGLIGLSTIKLEIIDITTKMCLASISSIEINSPDASIPVSFGIEVPPFEIYNAGRHIINLEINQHLVHTSPLIIHKT
ncbi:MAG TPA: hypothetical protein VKX40_10925 [Aequorivita sp.]|nr:hypothetical protein [Aequorivita sp.]